MFNVEEIISVIRGTIVEEGTSYEASDVIGCLFNRSVNRMDLLKEGHFGSTITAGDLDYFN